MGVRCIKILAAAVLMAVLLYCCVSGIAEEPLKPYQEINENDLLNVFHELDGNAAYEWESWRWELWLTNKALLSGMLKEDGTISALIVQADSDEEEDMQGLKDTLAFLSGITTEFPEAEAMLDAREEGSLYSNRWTLYIREGMFQLNPDNWEYTWLTPYELEELLEKAGLPEGNIVPYRSGTLAAKDYRAEVTVEAAGRLRSLNLYCYGEDSEAGKAFLSEISNMMTDGAELDETLKLISEQYDTLEVRQSESVKFDEFRVSLRRANDYRRLTFQINHIPWNAVHFTQSLDDMIAASKEDEPVDAAAFGEVDISAQIEPTILYQENGITVKALELQYSTAEETPRIGVKVSVEKEEGIVLDWASFSLDCVNRWEGNFRFSKESIPMSGKPAAETSEGTVWCWLNWLTDAIPDFRGISSIRMSTRLVPPEGAGDTLYGEKVSLETSLNEPLSGVTIFSNESITLNLTGQTGEDDRQLKIGLICDNRSSDTVELGIVTQKAKLNNFNFAFGCDMGIRVHADRKAYGELHIYRDMLNQLGITDLSQIEDLQVELMDYQTGERFGENGMIHITAEMLGATPGAEEQTSGQTVPETVLFDDAGLKLITSGLSADGRSLDVMLYNESGDTGAVAVVPQTINGWQVEPCQWVFQAKAGENYRQQLPLANLIPDFDGYSEIGLKIYPCERDAMTGMMTTLNDGVREITLAADPAAPQAYDDQGTVLLDTGDFHMILKEIYTDYEGGLKARIWLMNNSDRTIRWSESHNPLDGTSRAKCSVNGSEHEFYVLFGDLNHRIGAGLRKETTLSISAYNLGEIGMRAEDIRTLDFEWCLFPDAEQLEYTLYPVHIE